MAMNKIQTPDCPECGMPPVYMFSDQYWCGNDDCRVLCWTPSKTIAENIRESKDINE